MKKLTLKQAATASVLASSLFVSSVQAATRSMVFMGVAESHAVRDARGGSGVVYLTCNIHLRNISAVAQRITAFKMSINTVLKEIDADHADFVSSNAPSGDMANVKYYLPAQSRLSPIRETVLVTSNDGSGALRSPIRIEPNPPSLSSTPFGGTIHFRGTTVVNYRTMPQTTRRMVSYCTGLVRVEDLPGVADPGFVIASGVMEYVGDSNDNGSMQYGASTTASSRSKPDVVHTYSVDHEQHPNHPTANSCIIPEVNTCTPSASNPGVSVSLGFLGIPSVEEGTRLSFNVRNYNYCHMNDLSNPICIGSDGKYQVAMPSRHVAQGLVVDYEHVLTDYDRGPTAEPMIQAPKDRWLEVFRPLTRDGPSMCHETERLRGTGIVGIPPYKSSACEGLVSSVPDSSCDGRSAISGTLSFDRENYKVGITDVTKHFCDPTQPDGCVGMLEDPLTHVPRMYDHTSTDVCSLSVQGGFGDGGTLSAPRPNLRTPPGQGDADGAAQRYAAFPQHILSMPFTVNEGSPF